MARLALCLSVLVLVASATEEEAIEQLTEGIVEIVEPTIQELDDKLTSILKIYGQTIAWQQQTMMEKTRMLGNSGILQVRDIWGGTKPYFTNSHSRQNGQAAIHNHANNIRTCGMGESAVVMNGVEFRTRHNDYRLNKAHSTSAEYGATEPVEFPEVPESVTALATVEEQIAEMKEYFKAFATQNPGHRNYTPYFKPVLSYMQGMWTADTTTVVDPFFSDRHSIQADTWFKLQQDVIFATWSGKKDVGENLAVLPTMIYGVNDDASVKLAQWNYKILVHPLETAVPLNRFRVVDDLVSMMRSGRSTDEFAKTRSARFQLHPQPDSTVYDGLWLEEQSTGWDNFLEKLMNEVPGMSNYQADFDDSNFGEPPLKNVDGVNNLNAGYYHRYYSLAENDASGFSRASRGFADTNLFVALNNQTEIIPILVRKCVGGSCEYEEIRMSYAIPLEILYLTPLNRWNPYNITIHAENDFPTQDENGRSGRRRGTRNTTTDAYNGASERYYYLTPAEMFEGDEIERDSADTTQDSVYILDANNVVRRTVASGMRIFLPNIPGVGSVRTRYPVFNTYLEGNGVMKELSAVKDMVRFGATHSHLYELPLGGVLIDGTSGLERFTFALQRARSPHVHTFELTANQINAMRKGDNEYPGYTVHIATSEQYRHSHNLVVRMLKGRTGVYVWDCDGTSNGCSDGHPSLTNCLNCPIHFLEP